MENRKPDPRFANSGIRRARRNLFGAVKTKVVEESLDVQLSEIYKRDRERLSTDYTFDKVLNASEVPSFYQRFGRKRHISGRPVAAQSADQPSSSSTSPVDEARDNNADEPPTDVLPTVSPSTRKRATNADEPKAEVLATVSPSPRKRATNADENKADVLANVSPSTTRKRAPACSLVIHRPVTRSRSRMIANDENQNPGIQVTSPQTAAKKASPAKGNKAQLAKSKLKQAKLTNYLPVRKRSAAIKIGGPDGDTPDTRSSKVARLSSGNAPSPMRFLHDDAEKSDVDGQSDEDAEGDKTSHGTPKKATGSSSSRGRYTRTRTH